MPTLLAWALVSWVRCLWCTRRNSTETLGRNKKPSVVNYQASSGLKLPWRRSSGSMWCVWPTWGWEHRACGFSTEEKGKSGRVALLTSVLLGMGWDCFLLVPEMWGRGGVRKVKWAEIASFLPPFLEGLAVTCDMPDKLLPLYWNRPIQKYASHLKCCN